MFHVFANATAEGSALVSTCNGYVYFLRVLADYLRERLHDDNVIVFAVVDWRMRWLTSNPFGTSRFGK